MEKKEKIFVEFDNEHIKSFKPNYAVTRADGSLDWKKQTYTPFKVAKNSVLKGLKLYSVRGQEAGAFVLSFALNNEHKKWVIGKFSNSFGTRECENKIIKFAKGSEKENIPAHVNDQGFWIIDPKLTEQNFKRVIVDTQKEIIEKRTLNEIIIEYIKAGYPRNSKRKGKLDPSSIKRFNQALFGANQREKHIKILTKNDQTEIVFIPNKKTRVKAPTSFDELFEKYPPGKYLIAKGVFNPSGYISMYDSDIGKFYIQDLTQGVIKKFIKDRSNGVQRFLIRCFRNLWSFALMNEYLGNTPPKDPTRFDLRKETKDNQFSKYNKKIFSDDQIKTIAETCQIVRPDYPFQTECLELMMCTSIREEEAKKIKQKNVKIKEGVIELPGSITKTGQSRFIVITGPVGTILDHLEKLKTTPGYEWYNFVPWLFPSPRFRYQEFLKGKLTPEYINSSQTRLKEIRGVWLKIKELTGIQGAPKLFRKTYATKAKQIVGGDLAIKLTGHEDTATLDRFYYGDDVEQIKNDAAKVAEIYSFKKKVK